MPSIISKIPRTIKAVAFVSFLINTSTLMIFSIFGLYLHDKIGIDLGRIGFLDGAVDSFSFFIKIGSGVVSDFLMNRKLIFLIGAFFLFIAKPLEAIATSYWPLFQSKILERFGNGLQATPRDAIVGDWAPKGMKATCFGLRQALAAFGSVVGAIIAYVLMKQTGDDFQFIFWMAGIPSFLAIVVIALFVMDKKGEHTNTLPKEGKKYRKITIKDIKNLGPRYWVLMCVACTYMISKVTESIVIIYVTKSLHLPSHLAPICMICYSLASSFIALPAGILSDKLKSRENVFILGIIVFIASDMLFIFGNNIALMMVALVFLGCYTGISQSIFPAKIIDIIPADLKGTGIGIFNFACAISLLAGGWIFGAISEAYSMRMAFVASSFFAIIALCVLFFSKRFNKKFEEQKQA